LNAIKGKATNAAFPQPVYLFIGHAGTLVIIVCRTISSKNNFNQVRL